MNRPMALLGGLLTAAVVLAPAPALADGSGVRFGGYCVVAYVDARTPMYGSPQFRSIHDGKQYHFVSADAKAAFDKNPATYAPAVRYDAWCASALAMGKRVASDPEQLLVRDGAVFLFSSAEAKAMFEKDPEGMTKKADQNWEQGRK